MSRALSTTGFTGLAILAILVSPHSAAAQTERWGLDVGVSASRLDGDFIETREETKRSFLIGAYAERQVGPLTALQLGVNYAKKGGKGIHRDLGTGSPAAERALELDLKYVEVPFLLQITFPLGRTLSLIGYGGITAGFSVGCEAALGGAGEQPCGDTILGQGKLEWSLPAGGGVSFDVGGGEKVVLDARYVRGLSDAVSDQNLRNRTWQFILRLVKDI